MLFSVIVYRANFVMYIFSYYHYSVEIENMYAKKSIRT